jgi:hypothetical protein
VKAPPQLSTAAEMHCWIWDLRPTTPTDKGAGGAGGFRRGANTVLPGIYTIKLSVNGKSYTQTLTMKSDPRLK